MRVVLKGTVLNMLPTVIKGIVDPKHLISVVVYSLTLSQTCVKGRVWNFLKTL